MKTYKKVLLIALSVLPLIYTTIAVLTFMPDTVAAHFGADGSVDRWGSKYEAFILPGIVLLLSVVYMIIRTAIKKTSTDENDRTARNLDVTDTVVILTLLMLNALDVTVTLLMSSSSSLWEPASLAAIILSTVIGVTFILIGNIMPKTKRNSFVGLRMKFTMDTDEHWSIANRAGGVALVISGLITFAAGLIFRNMTYVFVMVAALIVTLTVAIIYSYVKIKGENKA